MRSLFVHLRDVSEQEVTEFLHRRFPYSNRDGYSTWYFETADDPVLLIDFYRDMNSEFEVEDWFALMDRLGSEPSVSVVADIPARHPGDEEVRIFACTMLEAFSGVAQDEYCDHYWTREEIERGEIFDGLGFFDRKGYYEREARLEIQREEDELQRSLFDDSHEREKSLKATGEA